MMMAPFKKHGRSMYSINVPTRAGQWVQRSTGTKDPIVARRIQRIVDSLGPEGAHAWPVLERVTAKGDDHLTLGELYDLWNEAGHNVDTLLRLSRKADLEPMTEQYLAAASCTVDTKAHYRALLRRLIPPGKPFPLANLSVANIQKAIDEIEGAAGTKRKGAAAIRSFCNWLMARGVIATNPVRDVRLPRQSAPRTNYLEAADAIKLAEAQPSPYREFSALLAGSGVEVSVALRLRRRDIDVKNREIRAAGTKTHARDRLVRVAEWAWPYVLRAIEGKLPDARLFEGIPHRWSARYFHFTAIEELKKESDVFNGYTMKDARHTFAVRAIRAGTPADLVARQLGHANATLVLTVYGRFQPTQEERSRWEAVAAAMDTAAAEELEREQSKKKKAPL